MATLGQKLGRSVLEQVASIVTPETILAWHRRLVAKKFDSAAARTPRPIGRPPVDTAVADQIIRLARENPTWGYRRIAGVLKSLGVTISHQTVGNVLAEHGVDPAPKRSGKSNWPDFIKSHADCLLATDFFTTEVWTALGLVTYYVLFFIHVGSRKVCLTGITRNPTDEWMRQVARNMTMSGVDVFSQCRYLLRDRDTKFTAGFDMILRSAGIEPLALPPRSANLNAFAERFVRSIKEECLDRMIFFGEASFSHAVREYITHHQAERPHQRWLDNVIPFPAASITSDPRDGPIIRRDRIGGLLKSYHRKEAA